MKKTKKGFTAVELVIAVAVVVVLASVLIPTIIGLARRANLNADQQAVRQMNEVLALEEKNRDINTVYRVLSQSNLDVEGYKTLTQDVAFYWIKDENKVALVDTNSNKVIFPAELVEKTFINSNFFPLIKAENKDPNNITGTFGFTDAPLASIDISAPIFVDEDIATRDRVNNAVLYNFRTNDDLSTANPSADILAQREKYGDWQADFAIIANDDFSAGSVGICGKYKYADASYNLDYPWIPLDLDFDLYAGESILLLDAVAQLTGIDANSMVTYNTLLNACKTQVDGNGNEYREGFHCGAYNINLDTTKPENQKSITVELRLYEPDGNDGRTGRYIIIRSIPYAFPDPIYK